MVLQFDNGFAEQIVESDSWSLKISAFTKPANTSHSFVESTIQKDKTKSPEVNIISKQIAKPLDNVMYFYSAGTNNSRLSTFSNAESFKLEKISDINIINHDTQVSIRLINKSLNNPHIFQINWTEGEIKRGGVDMIQKLITQRDEIEKFGTIGGITVGLLALTPSLFFSLEWAATIPAAVMFFSLPIFILMRKQLREERN